MKQIFLITGLFFLIFSSCKKEATTNAFHGLYIEVSPIAGRSQLNFINSKIVIKTETGSSYKDTFYYSFSADTSKIILTPAWTNEYSAHPIDFEKIDENSFRIENLYPSIPESPESYMIFKK
ncbi:MAG TPA: hypothetical protein VN726_19520 [Hanamia sp.]|nr:hypothetical protein [Hanamia sp.]